MSLVKVVTRVRISESDAKKFIANPGGPVYKAMLNAGAITRDRAKIDLTANSLVGTGFLRNSIESRVTVQGESVIARVGTEVPYAGYVHEGTSGPIEPQRARVLRFRPKGSVSFVFARSVRGTRETGRFSPFLTNALSKLNLNDLTT